MLLNLHACIHTYIHINIQTHKCTYINYIHIGVHTLIHTHNIHIDVHTINVHTHRWTYINIHTHRCTYINVHTHRCTYINVHTHWWTYINIHTHWCTYIIYIHIGVESRYIEHTYIYINIHICRCYIHYTYKQTHITHIGRNHTLPTSRMSAPPLNDPCSSIC